VCSQTSGWKVHADDTVVPLSFQIRLLQQLARDIPRSVLIGVVLPLLLVQTFGCGKGTLLTGPLSTGSSDTPQIVGLSPMSVFVDTGPQNITITGSNFMPSMELTLNGSDHPFKYLSEEEIVLPLSENETSTVGLYTLILTNLTGGKNSTAAAVLSVNYPKPTISELSPAVIKAGVNSQNILIYGRNFFRDSILTINGVRHPATYFDSGHLGLVFDLDDQVGSAPYTIMVFNPAPGGGNSNIANLSLAGISATISAVSPSSVAAGGSAFTLTVLGANFTVASFVSWNGKGIPTTYIGPDQLSALVKSSDFAFPGTATVTVEDPTNEGVTPSAEVVITGHVAQDALFVAPEGNDQGSGTMTDPFLTITKCATIAVRGQFCVLRGGTYHESVKPNSGVTIEPYDGEVVTLDGTDPITDWKSFKGDIYQAKVDLPIDDGNQLFVGKEMMTEARWPNGTDLFHVNWAIAAPGTSSNKIVDSRLPDLDWAGAKIHLWSGTNPFSHQTGVVTQSGRGTLGIDVGQVDTCPSICPAPGGYYYLYGSLAALDSEREWFYDSSNGTLYFWAPGGVNPNELDVRVKRRSYAFDLSGRSGVTITDINLFACAIFMDSSSQDNTLDGIEAQYVSHFTSLSPSENSMGGWSMILDHVDNSGIILDGTANILRNSIIEYSAGNGITLKGDGNTVENNLIYNVDYIGNYCAGIVIENYTNRTTAVVAHNTIHTAGRSTIEFLAAVNEDVSYNNLFGGMLLTRDGGEIYACCDQVAYNTRIHHNWIHDTQSLVAGMGSQYSLSGIYIDNGSSNFEIDQNVLWNNDYGNIILNGAGGTHPENNRVYNNSVPDLNPTGAIYLNNVSVCGSTTVADNQVLLPVEQASSKSVCQIVGNNASALGATEMGVVTDIGCTLARCRSASPPITNGNAVSASISVQPYDTSIRVGETATFSARAEGSEPLSYQWKRNGVNIDGANDATYLTPQATLLDQGIAFTVQVSNALGTVVSDRAYLSVSEPTR
jgi:hypothetical protein